MKLESAFKRRCEAIAVDWRHRFHLRVFDPLPAEQLLQALDGKAVTPDQLAHISLKDKNHLLNHSDWSAGVIHHHPLLIMYHPEHTAARYQSDMMHELAHILLDHPLIGFSPHTGLPLRHPCYEDQAAYLGSCLQIPRLGLQWAAQQGFTSKQVAAHFTASEQMVRFRSNLTGISIP